MSCSRPFVGAIVALMLSAVPALSDDPKTTFYDEAVLQGALADIAVMEETELRAFAGYLAECADAPVDPTAKHDCSSAQMLYEVEFGGDRPLDHLIVAKGTMAEMPPEPITDVEALTKEAVQYATVIVALEDATRMRFAQLR